MARPRTEESKIRDTLLAAKHRNHRGLSWKELQERTKLPRSTVTTILHRMIRESNATAKLEDRNGRPTPVYHYEPHAHWLNEKHSTKDRGKTIIKLHNGKVSDVEFESSYERPRPRAKIGGVMYSQAKRRTKIPRERWNINS